MKSFKEFLRKWYEILICLFFFLILVGVVFKLKDLEASDKIQAISVFGLIVITAFYAIQTQKLVIDERRRLRLEKEIRRAEYGGTRIKEFFNPLFYKLQELKDILQRIIDEGPESCAGPLRTYFEEELNEAINKYNEMEDIFNRNKLMASSLLIDSISGFLEKFTSSFPEGFKEREFNKMGSWVKEINDHIDHVRPRILEEMGMIETHIKRTYGYFN